MIGPLKKMHDSATKPVDPHNLQRFVRAQETTYEEVISELKGGVKLGHWMWFVFPQLKGLGTSEMSNVFGISGREEAQAYLEHPVLGDRLRDCTRLVLSVEGNSITEIFGFTDAKKFRSCVTLFARSSKNDDIFDSALKKYFNGVPDRLTLDRL